MDADTSPSESELIALADAVLALAHQLERRSSGTPGVEVLTNTEITVIREVHRTPGITATRIAATTGLQRSYVSASAHGLEGRGLLVRGAPDDGGRGVGFHPTAQADADLLVIQQGWVELLGPCSAALLEVGVEAAPALDTIARAIGERRASADGTPAPAVAE